MALLITSVALVKSSDSVYAFSSLFGSPTIAIMPSIALFESSLFSELRAQ
jgi:hypothetical protein